MTVRRSVYWFALGVGAGVFVGTLPPVQQLGAVHRCEEMGGRWLSVERACALATRGEEGRRRLDTEQLPTKDRR